MPALWNEVRDAFWAGGVLHGGPCMAWNTMHAVPCEIVAACMIVLTCACLHAASQPTTTNPIQRGGPAQTALNYESRNTVAPQHAAEVSDALFRRHL